MPTGSQAWLYVIRLTSGALYIGVTRDIERRLVEHYEGRGGSTTEKDRSAGVLHVEEFATFTEALKRERQIKRWTRAKKEALILSDMARLRQLSRRRTL